MTTIDAELDLRFELSCRSSGKKRCQPARVRCCESSPPTRVGADFTVFSQQMGMPCWKRAEDADGSTFCCANGKADSLPRYFHPFHQQTTTSGCRRAHPHRSPPHEALDIGRDASDGDLWTGTGLRPAPPRSRTPRGVVARHRMTPGPSNSVHHSPVSSCRSSASRPVGQVRRSVMRAAGVARGFHPQPAAESLSSRSPPQHAPRPDRGPVATPIAVKRGAAHRPGPMRPFPNRHERRETGVSSRFRQE